MSLKRRGTIRQAYGSPIESSLHFVQSDLASPSEFASPIMAKKFPVDNLWKVNLTGYWRMLYTIKGEELEIICFILEICDHKDYNKLFGFKQK